METRSLSSSMDYKGRSKRPLSQVRLTFRSAGKNLLHFLMRPWDNMNADQLAHAPRRRGARVGGGFHRAHIAAHGNGDEARADVLFPYQNHIGRFHHGVSRLNGADQTLRFDKA